MTDGWGLSGTVRAHCPRCAHLVTVDLAGYARVSLNLRRHELTIVVAPVTFPHTCIPELTVAESVR